MTAKITSKIQNLHIIIYEKIKSQIINFTLKPGQKLQDRQLGLEFGVSRTPIREALNRLVQEGFVRQISGRGYFVKEISIKDIEEIYEVREALEVLAAQQAVRNINNHQIKRLSEILKSHEKLIQKGEVKSRLLKDADFHKTIALSSENRYLYEIINNIFDKIAVFKGIGVLSLQRAKTAYQQHKEIFNSLKERDAQALEKKLRKHISNAKQKAIERLKKKTGLLYIGHHI
ncbi:GntR family transcriptional regulator [Candidatus Aerophobetes bacterium]|nr:GntR family transcriptional regulator [Candidatus Aerophobetes bacterium]